MTLSIGVRGNRHLIGVLVTLLGSFLGLTGLITSAVLTDSKSVTGNTITAATVTLTTSVTNAAITAPAMSPGDTIYAPITVTNGGTTALRYALTSTTDATDNNFLAAQLVLSIVANATCNGSTSFTSPLYSSVFGSTGGTNVLGNPAQGAQAGDRTLAVNASETLCFKLQLPITTTNTYAGKTTTATLAFNAEQTANN